MVSAWEIVLKHRSGKMAWPFSGPDKERHRVETIVERCGFGHLELSFAHAEEVMALQLHHRDPFDHMLVAQARLEDLTLVTHDKALGLYGVPVLWA